MKRVSMATRNELVEAIAARYDRSDRAAKARILDKFVAVRSAIIKKRTRIALYVGFCGPALHIRSVAEEWAARLTPWHRSPRTRFWPHSFMLC